MRNADPFLITNVAGNIEFVNPAFCRITGYTEAEALGQNPRILKSGRQAAAFYRDMWATLRRGEVWQGEFVNKKKNGELYWESAIISPIRNSQNRVTHYLAIKDDITTQKMAQEALTNGFVDRIYGNEDAPEDAPEDKKAAAKAGDTQTKNSAEDQAAIAAHMRRERELALIEAGI